MTAAVMKLAYADPPYLGCCRRYGHRHQEPYGCWDDVATHLALFEHLTGSYDGWALSSGASGLQQLLAIAPAGVRVAAWVKPFNAFKKHVRIAYGWEPVIFMPARPNNCAEAPKTRDWLSENMTLQRGLIGAKPPRFCRWVLDLLGYMDGDEVTDIFPGTGVMGQTVAQGVLA